jgi:hypothetical protein
VSPALAMTIAAARDLAWRPTSNLGGNRASAYEPRLEAHRRLVDALGRVTGLSANASPELRFLLAAIRRVAACSFSNRMGLPYYERKQSVAELRGCLVIYDREAAVRASRPRGDFAELGIGARLRRRPGIELPEPTVAVL